MVAPLPFPFPDDLLDSEAEPQREPPFPLPPFLPLPDLLDLLDFEDEPFPLELLLPLPFPVGWYVGLLDGISETVG